tara:strand:- start:3596 stop:5308 length:1713 start_codon:yes stop_codon:yes gene_type:complete
MIKKKEPNPDYLEEYGIEQEELNLKDLFKTLSRNKKLISTIALSFLAISGIIAFGIKRTWQGEFQIVLEMENDLKSNIPISSGLGGLADFGFGLKDKKLNTEVGILKSPSVLMETFEYIKTQKSKNNKVNDLRFKEWLDDYIVIELEKKTSILNIAYKDKDKEFIVPVLQKISAAYQKYSIEDRLKNIDLGIVFLEQQLKNYKERSTKSIIEKEKYAIENNLSVNRIASDTDDSFITIINVEASRKEGEDTLNTIQRNLKQLNNSLSDSDLDYDQLLFVAKEIPEINNTLVLSELQLIANEILTESLIYKQSDKNIQSLLKRKESLIDQLNKNVKGVLLAKKFDAELKIKASERPEGVLRKYKKLINDATKDQVTLDKLENRYIALLLEKARIEEPWELITKPTLLSRPISPKRKRILALGLLLGIVVGSVSSVVKEKNTKIIYSKNTIKKIINLPILSEISFKEDTSWRESLSLTINGILIQCEGSIALLVQNDTKKDHLEKLKQYIKDINKEKNVIITSDLVKSTTYNNIVILVSLGYTKINDIENINEKLYNHKDLISGYIVINELI